MTSPVRGAGALPSRGARFTGAMAQRTAAGVADDAGDVLFADPVERARAEAEEGKRRSVVRGALELLTLPRTAAGMTGRGSHAPRGVEQSRWDRMTVREQEAYIDAHASDLFDPTDPASMTESRWAGMSREEQDTWLQANMNMRDAASRDRLIGQGITGAFDTIKNFIDSEREKRLTEIRESADTARTQIRSDADVEIARINGEVQRARAAADEARAAVEAATARAASAQDAQSRAAAETARLEAQTRADAAAAERTRLESEQRALTQSSQSDSQGWSTGTKIAVGVGGTGVLVTLLLVLRRAMQPPPPPPPPPAIAQFEATR